VKDGRIDSIAGRAGSGTAVLDARDVGKEFGGLTAVRALSLRVFEGEVLGLIGPNGSGKTTFFNVVTGVHRASGGRVTHRGRDITDWPAYRIAQRGIARTFQHARIFHNASALENVLVGRHLAARSRMLHVLFATGEYRRREREARECALRNLEFVGLADRADERAGDFPYGAMKRLEIARALSLDPDVLMLDEPAAGLNPREADDLMKVLQEIRAAGRTIVIIEHNMRIVMSLCQRIVVIDTGSKIAEGSPKEVQGHPRVREAYLGRGA